MKGGFTTEGTEFTEIDSLHCGRHQSCFYSVLSVTSVVKMLLAKRL